MLNYAKLKTEFDFQQAKTYCETHGLEFPKNNAVCFGAFTETGMLVGLVAVVANVQIEPLIADSALSAQILLEKGLAWASSVTKQVEVVVNAKNEKVIDYAKRSGFYPKDENMVILRKEI